ncbi:MAG TPA: hypothetical protein VMV45_09690 [Casimicrobiaceae bacterium]|nr:hypothetical protein [Casimicrobiaceae bacterium]
MARHRSLRGRFAFLIACVFAANAFAASDPAAPGARPAPAGDATALKARYLALRSDLEANAFGLALHVESRQADDRLAGDLYGVVKQAFPRLREALIHRTQWCELLMLHINVKDCRVSREHADSMLTLNLGGKHDEGAAGVAHLDYLYRVVADTPDYLQIELSADKGPYGTTDHHIVLEATGLPGDRVFMHLSYSHAYGPVARLALSTYLNTIGRDKVGFSVVDRTADGRPVYVGGIRGVVERNCMRYYLAVMAYLETLSGPPEQRVERRLADWFQFTERYPRQLHEVSESEYLDMKRTQYRRLTACSGTPESSAC